MRLLLPSKNDETTKSRQLKTSQPLTDLAQGPCSLILFGAEAGKSVRNEELQLISSLHNFLALLRADVVSDLHGVLLVVHEEHLQVSRTMYQELVEAIL